MVQGDPGFTMLVWGVPGDRFTGPGFGQAEAKRLSKTGKKT